MALILPTKTIDIVQIEGVGENYDEYGAGFLKLCQAHARGKTPSAPQPKPINKATSSSTTMPPPNLGSFAYAGGSTKSSGSTNNVAKKASAPASGSGTVSRGAASSGAKGKASGAGGKKATGGGGSSGIRAMPMGSGKNF